MVKKAVSFGVGASVSSKVDRRLSPSSGTWG